MVWNGECCGEGILAFPSVALGMLGLLLLLLQLIVGIVYKIDILHVFMVVDSVVGVVVG